MTKSLIKTLRRVRDMRLETGFSMLEAVVVVGVLLALAVGGFFSYGAITENAKIAKVKSTASELHTAVLVSSFDGDPNTKPEDVIGDWNNSTDKIFGEIISPAAGETSANGDYCVQATNKESPHIKARAGACDGIPAGSNPGSNPDDLDGDGIPNDSDPDIDGDGTPNAEDPTPNGDPVVPGDGSGGNIIPATWSGSRTIINRYPDPGFKNGISGWTGDKIQKAYTNDALTSVSLSPTGYNGDAGALKISATGSVGHDTATVYFPIDTGTVRNFSFQITTPDGTWHPNASWSAGVMSTDKSTGNVIWSNGYGASRAGGLGANVWERIDTFNNSNPPADTPHNNYLVIQADHIPVDGTVSMLVDRVFVSADCGMDCEAPQSSVGGFERNFDGSYPSSTDWSFSWSGAVNNSESKAVSPKAIAAPASALIGDTIQVKGSGYPANSTVTPAIFMQLDPTWGDPADNIYADPVQTDASGKFDTTVKIPEGTRLWKWNVGVVEDTNWRALAVIEIDAPAGPVVAPPGPWSELVAGSTEQISAPSVITVGQDFVVMGRGYEPYTQINVWSDNYESDGIDVYPYTDKNGNFTVTIPSSGATPGPGALNTWWNDNVRLNVTFQ